MVDKGDREEKFFYIDIHDSRTWPKGWTPSAGRENLPPAYKQANHTQPPHASPLKTPKTRSEYWHARIGWTAIFLAMVTVLIINIVKIFS